MCEFQTAISSYAEMCKDFEPKRPTNADRIRSMSDEELAEFLMEVGMGSLFEKKITNVKDWLQSEVEE